MFLPARKKDDPVPELEDIDAGDEYTRVVNWRFRQARRLGFDYPEAEEIAYASCDLEQVRRMARDGCDPAVIVRIVT